VSRARWRGACGIALLLACAAVPAHAACLKANADNQVAEGKLVSVRIRIEAYKRTDQAWILQLRTPACLEGSDDIDKVKKAERIHVFSLDEPLRKRIRSLVGKSVRVTGSAFGEHTAHHHAPIVMNVTRIDPL
jgi:hypothetical protein